jgi:hypothetical protein
LTSGFTTDPSADPRPAAACFPSGASQGWNVSFTPAPSGLAGSCPTDPAPPAQFCQETGLSPEAVVSCRPGQTWSCRRLSTTPGAVATENTGTVTISHQGIVVATGRSFLPVGGRLRLHVSELQRLVPGRYDLVIVRPGQLPQKQTIWIDQPPDVRP